MWYLGPKTSEICIKVLLFYFFIILSQIDLEKVILNKIYDFRTACKHVDCHYEYSRSNKENLPLPIKIKLSGKQLTFGFMILKILEST